MEVSEFYDGMKAVLIQDIPNSETFIKGVEVVVNKGPDWDRKSTIDLYVKHGTVMTYINLPGGSPFSRQKCYLHRLKPLGPVQLSFDFGEVRVQLGPPSLV